MSEQPPGRNFPIPFLIVVLLMTCLSFARPIPAVERDVKGPVNIEADQLTYDKEEDTYHASGNVIITFQDGFLVADSVVYNRKTDDAFADGDVFVVSKKDTLEGEKVRFNVSSRTGVVYRGKAFLSENHLYLTGAEIQKRGEDTYRLKEATATTCDGPDPSWRFTAQQLDVTVEGYGTMKKGTFDVKNVPILYAPYFVFPAKTKRQSGFLLPTIGYSRDINGLDIEVPFYWAISDSTDATFYQRYLEKRGFKEGMEFRYFISKDSFGTFYADYLNDTKEVAEVQDSLVRNWTENQRRWSYYLNHETTFTPGFYFRTDIARVSDHWYFRDFNGSNYYLDNYSTTGTNKFQRIGFYADKSLASLDSIARVVKDWRTYNLTTYVKYTDNLASQTNDATPQSYPYVTFTGVNQPIFNSPVNFQLSSSYQYVYRAAGEKGHWADANPIFSLPRNFGDYVTVTPSLGLRGTAWEGRGGIEDKNGDRELYTLGLNAFTEVQRIFDVNFGSVNKVRHSIRPEVTYSYIPNVKQDNLPDFVPVVPQTNTVTYSLTNSLIAKVREPQEKKGGKGRSEFVTPKPEKFSYLEFLRFVISQTFDINEYRSSKPEADRRPFGPFTGDLTFQPYKYLAYRGQYTFDTNDGEWKAINHDVSVSDWRGDTATVGYRYSQDILEEINLSLAAKVTNAVNVKYIQRRNEFDHIDLEKTYAVEYKKQCWSVELSFSDLDNDRRVMAVFSLFGLGKVGGFQATPGTLASRQ
jgi:LPS-assembly protein